MRIEINAGGLGGSIAISEFQSDISKFISNVDSVISSFKTVKNEIYDVNGGTTNLQEALDNVEARINLEEEKKESAQKVQRKAENFLDLVVRIDKQVAEDVNKNKEAFYKTNPWLRPPTSVDPNKVWYEQAWDWICGTAEEIAKDVKAAWEWTKDTLKKAWDGLVNFYNEHKKLIDTILIVVGAVAAIAAVVVSGGGALIPLLTALGCSSAVAATISGAVAVVAVVSTVASSAMNVVDIWCEIENETFQAWKKGLGYVSAISNGLYSIGSIYNSFKKISPEQTKEMMKNAFSDSGAQKVTSSKATGIFSRENTNINQKTQYSDVNQLSKKQVDAIYKYTGNDCYENINNSLRGLETATPENVETIKTMKSVLDNSSLPQDMTLYRGTTTSALGDLKDFAPDELIGKTFIEDGFMSTSSNNVISNAFKGDMHITIEASKGSKALNISPISKLPFESEYLFNAGQEMLITSAERIKGILHISVMIQ